MALNTVSSDRLSTNVKTSNLGTELKGKVGKSKNLIINGAMQVAQRGTSASVTGGYLTVDRYETATGGVNEAPTQAQADVTSGGAYDAGFRKCLKVTNGNQTSTDAGDNIIALRYKVEAQDMAQSGWGYTSSSNYVTLSFWIKSSIAQSFQGVLVTSDGTSLIYPFETGSLTQNTWTKITKTIPGNASITFNNDNGEGLRLEIVGYSGSSFANNSATINAWQGYASGIQFGRASTATWYEADDATLEITGVQLEVGSVATDFEHRSYDQELKLCERYFEVISQGDAYIAIAMCYNSSTATGVVQCRTTKRAIPTIYQTSGSSYYRFYRDGSSEDFSSFNGLAGAHVNGGAFYQNSALSHTSGHAGGFHGVNANTLVALQAEL